MQTREQEPTLIYRSGTSPALGAGWDVMVVTYRGKQSKSVVIARDACGAVVRRIDNIPERWEVINDPETLQGYKEWFDDRDRLVTEQAAVADRKVEDDN